MLHIINQALLLERCLRFANQNDEIILIEDGVYAALNNTPLSMLTKNALREHAIYALSEDIQARGLQKRVLDGINLVNYTGFVDLVINAAPTQTWF